MVIDVLMEPDAFLCCRFDNYVISRRHMDPLDADLDADLFAANPLNPWEQSKKKKRKNFLSCKSFLLKRLIN